MSNDPRPHVVKPPAGAATWAPSIPLLDHPSDAIHTPGTPSQARALAVAAMVATFAIVWIAMPVGIGLLLGTLVAFTLEPLYRRLRLRSGRPRLSALVCVAVAALGFFASVGVFGYLLIVRGIAFAQELRVSLDPGGAAREFLVQHETPLRALHLDIAALTARLQGATSELAARAAGVASVVAGVTFVGLVTVFFALMAIYFILQNWTTMVERAERILPLHPRHTHQLLDEFRRAGRTVLFGTVATGLAQGLLAGLAYWLFGVPHAAFFGAATAAASLVPGVGTLLVWVPIGIFLIVTGHVVRGIFELVYGLVIVVGASEYVLRPLLVGGRRGQGRTPALLTFVALFGGVEVFGLIGIILGPVLMSLSLALLGIFESEAAERLAASRRVAPERAGVSP